MNIFNAFLLGFTLLATQAFAEVSGDAPGFTLQGVDGEINLADYKGQVVYLDFWASWCSPCRDSFPWMNAMQGKYADKGVKFIAVNVDRKQADAEAFLQKTPAQFTIAFDPKGKTPKLYDLMGMPTAFIIGKDGKILHHHIGFNATDIEAYEHHLQQALQH